MPVTLNQVKDILNIHSIPFEEVQYDNQFDFLQVLETFPIKKYTSPYPVLALTIKSNNGRKDISIEFDYIEGTYVFHDVFFGALDYEFFDLGEEYVEESILEAVTTIMKNNTAVICAIDLKRQRWLWDGSFDMGGPDPHDRYEFERMVKKIERPKKGLSKLLKHQTRYEIYDWNTYRCVEK